MQISSIVNLTSTLNRHKGAATTNRFVVSITPPASLINEGVSKDLVFLCSSTILPGLSFQTENIMMKGYGMPEQRPNGAAIDDVPLLFICDNAGHVLNFFHKWAQKIFNFDHTTAAKLSQGTASDSFGYPDQTWGTVMIAQYSTSMDKVITYTMHKAIPKIVGSIQLGWEQNDIISQLPVTFGYKSWSTTATETNNITENPMINKLSLDKAASLIGTVRNTPEQLPSGPINT